MKDKTLQQILCEEKKKGNEFLTASEIAERLGVSKNTILNILSRKLSKKVSLNEVKIIKISNTLKFYNYKQVYRVLKNTGYIKFWQKKQRKGAEK